LKTGFAVRPTIIFIVVRYGHIEDEISIMTFSVLARPLSLSLSLWMPRRGQCRQTTKTKQNNQKQQNKINKK
jgi:hypothetical protein